MKAFNEQFVENESFKRFVGDLRRNVVADALSDPVGVSEQRAELLIERLQDVAQAIELGLGLVAASIRRHRLDLGICIRQSDLHSRLLLDSVAVHVDGFEDALGEVLLLRCRQLGRQQIEQDR